MLRGVDRLRAGALLLTGAAAVHEGRVLAEGHGGLASNPHHAVPLFVATAVVLLLAAVVDLARARTARALPSLRALWTGAFAALVAIHLAQEAIEGGMQQAFAPATLVAAACALLVAVVIAFALRQAERLIARRAPRRAPRPRAVAVLFPRAPRRLAARLAPLARNLAGRAPPAVG